MGPSCKGLTILPLSYISGSRSQGESLDMAYMDVKTGECQMGTPLVLLHGKRFLRRHLAKAPIASVE